MQLKSLLFNSKLFWLGLVFLIAFILFMMGCTNQEQQNSEIEPSITII